MIGIVYALGSKLPRRVVVTDDMGELDRAAAVQDGEGLIVRKQIADGTLETLRAVIAEETGVPVEEHASGRCAVVDADSRLVGAFIVADPALDAMPGKELALSDAAALNWKLTTKGQFLARMVTGDREGKVEAVAWLEPGTVEKDGKLYAEDSHAKPGEVVEALKITEAASEGTVKL